MSFHRSLNILNAQEFLTNSMLDLKLVCHGNFLTIKEIALLKAYILWPLTKFATENAANPMKRTSQRSWAGGGGAGDDGKVG